MNIIDGEIVGSRAAAFLDYVDAIGRGGLVSRREMAERMGVSYSTARYNLDRAVAEKYLNRQYGFVTANQPGWLYAWRDSMPKLPGDFSDD